MSDKKKVKGGMARAAALSAERRKEIAEKAARARWGKKDGVPQAYYSGEISLGDVTLPCAVLSDGTRVLTESDFMKGMGMYRSGALSTRRETDEEGGRVPLYLAFKNLEPFIDKYLGDVDELVLKYYTEKGSLAHGIKAEIIPKICDVWIDAQEAGGLGVRQQQVAEKANLIMRALAHVGIIALIDEATGFQRDRAANALAIILEKYIAKELQPWVKTFPDEFYEQLYRLRGLEFPNDRVNHPQYFGHLTNDIIYRRLAPAVLEELRSSTPKDNKGRYKSRFFQRLTPELGHPKLREHLASVITIMKLSNKYSGFKSKLDTIHPPYNETLPLFECDEPEGI